MPSVNRNSAYKFSTMILVLSEIGDNTDHNNFIRIRHDCMMGKNHWQIITKKGWPCRHILFSYKRLKLKIIKLTKIYDYEKTLLTHKTKIITNPYKNSILHIVKKLMNSNKS